MNPYNNNNNNNNNNISLCCVPTNNFDDYCTVPPPTRGNASTHDNYSKRHRRNTTLDIKDDDHHPDSDGTSTQSSISNSRTETVEEKVVKVKGLQIQVQQATTALKHKRRFCRINGCIRMVKSQGLCQRHGAATRPCRIENCSKQAQGNYDRMCKAHYKLQNAIEPEPYPLLNDSIVDSSTGANRSESSHQNLSGHISGTYCTLYNQPQPQYCYLTDNYNFANLSFNPLEKDINIPIFSPPLYHGYPFVYPTTMTHRLLPCNYDSMFHTATTRTITELQSGSNAISARTYQGDKTTSNRRDFNNDYCLDQVSSSNSGNSTSTVRTPKDLTTHYLN